jgi:amino acid transporter
MKRNLFIAAATGLILQILFTILTYGGLNPIWEDNGQCSTTMGGEVCCYRGWGPFGFSHVRGYAFRDRGPMGCRDPRHWRSRNCFKLFIIGWGGVLSFSFFFGYLFFRPIFGKIKGSRILTVLSLWGLVLLTIIVLISSFSFKTSAESTKEFTEIGDLFYD